MELKPLDITIKRCVINGQMLDVVTYDEYAKNPANRNTSTGVIENKDGIDLILPYRGKRQSSAPTLPGIYNAGCIDFVVFPTKQAESQYKATNIIELSNKNSMKEILEKEETISRLSEPWITSPDNITVFPIDEDDQPEMRCLKTALNEKQIDFDKYAVRFKDNFPNDKRQLKNNSVTLNIIKRFCTNCDMEAVLILRDKNPNVPNPIGREISVSLTEDYYDMDEN